MNTPGSGGAGRPARDASVLFILFGAVAAAAPDARPTARPLPPLSTTCPMHPEVVDDKGGRCPMNLQPVRLDVV